MLLKTLMRGKYLTCSDEYLDDEILEPSADFLYELDSSLDDEEYVFVMSGVLVVTIRGGGLCGCSMYLRSTITNRT